VENYQQKQEITPSLIQDLLEDLRAGLSEEEIARKYKLALLSPPCEGLSDQHHAEAVERSLSPSVAKTPQASTNSADRETEESSYICPTCLTAFAVMFDICPTCSASVQESIGRCEDEPAPEIPIAAEADQNPPGQTESKPIIIQGKGSSACHQQSGTSIVGPKDKREPLAVSIAVTSPGTAITENVTGAAPETSLEHALNN